VSQTTDHATSAATEQVLASFEIRPSKIGRAVAAPTGEPSVAAAPFGPPGEVGEMGIPLLVFEAYKHAEAVVKVEQPSCQLPWWLLAGIGHTESGHAESGRLYADGTTRGRILGPRLDGRIAGDAIIRDTDRGIYDGDTEYDRAVGPMQFIPSTWRSWAVDGNGDGKQDLNNIFDASLAAGHYLCAGGRDLATPAGLRAAILSYNHSEPYLQTVLAWGIAYRDHGIGAPDSPLPVITDVTKVRPPLTSRPPKLPPPSTHSSLPSTSTAASTSPASSTSPVPSTSSPSTAPSCPSISSSTAASSASSATASSVSDSSVSDSSTESGSSMAATTATDPSTSQAPTTPSGCPS
jgi:hypothetical protein